MAVEQIERNETIENKGFNLQSEVNKIVTIPELLYQFLNSSNYSGYDDTMFLLAEGQPLMESILTIGEIGIGGNYGYSASVTNPTNAYGALTPPYLQLGEVYFISDIVCSDFNGNVQLGFRNEKTGTLIDVPFDDITVTIDQLTEFVFTKQSAGIYQVTNTTLRDFLRDNVGTKAHFAIKTLTVTP